MGMSLCQWFHQSSGDFEKENLCKYYNPFLEGTKAILLTIYPILCFLNFIIVTEYSEFRNKTEWAFKIRLVKRKSWYFQSCLSSWSHKQVSASMHRLKILSRCSKVIVTESARNAKNRPTLRPQALAVKFLCENLKKIQKRCNNLIYISVYLSIVFR